MHPSGLAGNAFSYHKSEVSSRKRVVVCSIRITEMKYHFRQQVSGKSKQGGV
jgi:hypothetical protein